MLGDGLLIVTAGAHRYAVAQRSVQALHRVGAAQTTVALAEALGNAAADEEPYVLIVTGTSREVAFRVRSADLRSQLPQFDLPAWIARQAHPAIAGLILDGAELMPLLDLARLALQTGHEAP